MKVAVLGGFGLMAEASLHDLAANPHVTHIYAADLNLGRAKSVLARIPNRRKIQPVQVDLTDIPMAARALKGSDCVLNCSWYEYNLKAMDVSLALKAHYVDLGGLYHMTLKQLARDKEFKRIGKIAALGCGSTPGITNMMVSVMSEDFTAIDTVLIYDASYDPALTEEAFLPPFSIRTMLAEYELAAPVWKAGRIKEVPAHSEPDEMDFKEPIGHARLGTVIHSETATLPYFLKNKGVKNLCFKIAYPESVKRQLAMLSGMGLSHETPIRVNGFSVSPRHFLTALTQQAAVRAWQQPTSAPQDFEVLRVKITGAKNGRPLEKIRDCEIRPQGNIAAGTAAVGFTGAVVALLLCQGHTQIASGAGAPESVLKEKQFFRELNARRIFKFEERATYPVTIA